MQADYIPGRFAYNASARRAGNFLKMIAFAPAGFVDALRGQCVNHSSQSRWRAGYTGFAAATFWFALIVQFLLSLQRSYAAGTGVLHALWAYFAYFTILTNLLAASALASRVLAPQSRLAVFCARPGVIAALLAYMLLVGIAYHLLLRHTWQPEGWQWGADVLLHSVNPALFVGYWWSQGRGEAIGYSAILIWICYPLAYFAYALARGLAGAGYAYPFIDVDALGLARVLGNAVAIALGFAFVAANLIALGRRAPREHSS